MPPPVRIEHLASAAGAVFALHHAPAVPSPRAALVFVHALAEEMNKSRRMAALQARALAQAGFAVLQPDLHGCGDSAGEFADARWPLWQQNLQDAMHWLQARHPGTPLWLWGHRAGALLAVQAAAQAEGPAVAGLLLWQPLASGDQALRPWRRMQQMAAMLGGRTPPAQGSSAGLQAAGYHFHAELVQALQAARLNPPMPAPETVWLDLHDPAAGPGAGPDAAWAGLTQGFSHQSLPGAAFWRSTEIDEVPGLIDATTQALLAACPARHA